MKAKFIESCPRLITGKIYEVKQHPNAPLMYLVVNEEGKEEDFFKYRFQLVSSPEEKIAEIEEIKARLSILEKELADLKKPRVGQKYLHRSGDKYVLACVEKKYVLACYDTFHQGYLGSVYGKPQPTEERAFGGFFGDKKVFTLIEE